MSLEQIKVALLAVVAVAAIATAVLLWMIYDSVDGTLSVWVEGGSLSSDRGY